MSRIVKNYNGWGSGDLNGTPSSDKTNGEQLKRFGPLGLAGVGGVVRKNGSEHEIVYELSGSEVLTENGVNAVGVLRVELPDTVGRVESAIIKVSEAFTALSTIAVDLTSQAAAGGGFATTSLIAAADLAAVGIFDATLTIIPADLLVFEGGGSMTVDFTNTIAGPGKAELIIKYTSL
jgi:hypothetical protein